MLTRSLQHQGSIWFCNYKCGQGLQIFQIVILIPQCLNVGSESFFGKHTVSKKNRCKNKEKKGKNWKLETMSHQPGFHGGGGSKEGGAAGGELRLLPGRPPGAPGWAPTALVMLQYRQP